jgi:hypothetical protein
MRAYDVDAGEVLVGGVNVKQWHLPSLRASLGYVSQDPVLFATSIRENIALGSGVQAVVGGKVEGAWWGGGTATAAALIVLIQGTLQCRAQAHTHYVRAQCTHCLIHGCTATTITPTLKPHQMTQGCHG